MLKTRDDFLTKAEYKRYTRSNEFMHTYKVYGKTAREIQEEMVFPENWMGFLEAAVQFIHTRSGTEEYTAYDMFELVDEIMEYTFRG